MTGSNQITTANMNWEGKVVFITGSSKGIGKAMAYEIGKLGASIVINARNINQLKNAQQELEHQGLSKVFAIQGDISIPEDCKLIVDSILKEYGKIDILINNAGVFADESPLLELSNNTFKKLIDVNLLGAVYMTKAVMPSIIKTNGSILFIGSAAGFHGLGGHSAYSSSKMAVTSIAQSLRKELSKTNVHIGLLNVGFTENDEQKTIYDQDGKVIPMPNRGVGKKDSPQNVAKRAIRLIERRKATMTLTTLGKLNSFMSRLAPWLVHLILKNAYHKNRSK